MNEFNHSKQNKTPVSTINWLLRIVLWGGGLALAGMISILIIIAIALAVAFPNLPDIDRKSVV